MMGMQKPPNSLQTLIAMRIPMFRLHGKILLPNYRVKQLLSLCAKQTASTTISIHHQSREGCSGTFSESVCHRFASRFGSAGLRNLAASSSGSNRAAGNCNSSTDAACWSRGRNFCCSVRCNRERSSLRPDLRSFTVASALAGPGWRCGCGNSTWRVNLSFNFPNHRTRTASIANC